MATTSFIAIIAVVVLKGVTANYSIFATDAQVQVLVGKTATLKCQYTVPANLTDKVLNTWNDGPEMLYLLDTRVQGDAKRMSVSWTANEMVLEIQDVTLDDEKDYSCGLNGIEPPVYGTVTLTVNQYPQEFYVENIENIPQDGEEAAVARCVTKGSKPEPKMWFSDGNDDALDLVDIPEVTYHDRGLVDMAITLKKTFTKNDDGKSYKCNVERADGSTVDRETRAIEVHFAPSVSLEGVVRNSIEVFEEGNSFDAVCRAQGNPEPTITWSFTPDASANVSLPEGENLPSNLQASGPRIFSNGLIVTRDGSTNNGTLTCSASNGIGSEVSAQFKIGVYAAPVTTVPTTTALPDVTTKQEASRPIKQPNTAGSNGAVIAGVVAVAAFVVIVAILLIARYFMSHKGTYHTKEAKLGEDEERGGTADDEDGEFLEERKRTEYFL